ncbi:MAG: fructose-1,6-bisphosphatase [Thermoplasmata archaeon]|nr:fructose-1,6-bisphosphatase [Thermoplasmata archaeon]MCI4354752.1 fructose-1,6-bisphosphatase [Thermoplasmata archaeon]
MPALPDRELEVLFRIAAAVQSVVRQSATSPHRGDVVAMGADGSPTEELDRIAEGQVLEVLEEEGVDWDVLSEEIGLVRRGGGKLLVVDPIDGSHNALRNMPFATISLALGRGTVGGIEKGVVRDLTNGLTYWASIGGGAFRDGRRIRTRSWDLRSELFFVNLGRHSTPNALSLAEHGRRIRSLGCASLEIAMVAQGAADAYFFENDTRPRNLRVTDIAAAYRILLEAGGGMTDAAGRPVEAIPLDLAEHTSVFAYGDAAFARSRAGGPTP